MGTRTTTRSRILVAVPPGPARPLWRSYLETHGWEVLMLDRESVVRDQRVTIEDDAVLVDGRTMSPNTRAIILDSGYMWQIPVLDPDIETWQAHRDHFDDLLRNERETRSFWYSLLEIFNDRLPACINRQEAFSLEALKPSAFDLLASAGIPVAPWLVSNDAEVLEAFFGGSGLMVNRPLIPDRRARILSRSSLKNALKDAGVLFLQRLDASPLVDLWVVGTRVVFAEQTSWTGSFLQEQAQGGTPGEQSRPGVLDREPATPPDIKLPGDVATWVEAHLPAAMTVLHADFAILTLARVDGACALADFCPSPDVSHLPPTGTSPVLDAVVRRLEEMRS